MAWRRSGAVHSIKSERYNAMTAGVNNTTPNASPIHQNRNVWPYSSHGITPPVQANQNAPLAALIVVLINAPKISKRITSDTVRSK